MHYCIFDTSWGSFGFVARKGKLVGTFLPLPGREMRAMVARSFPEAVENPDLLPEFQGQIAAYFEGRPTRFGAPVDLSNVPPFHRRVLEACKRIPYGRTSSYGELAKAVGSPAAARAVGGAMGRNPLPLVIPCHRVLAAGGRLGGFSSRGGCGEKERLLELEQNGKATKPRCDGDVATPSAATHSILRVGSPKQGHCSRAVAHRNPQFRVCRTTRKGGADRRRTNPN